MLSVQEMPPTMDWVIISGGVQAGPENTLLNVRPRSSFVTEIFRIM